MIHFIFISFAALLSAAATFIFTKDYLYVYVTLVLLSIVSVTAFSLYLLPLIKLYYKEKKTFNKGISEKTGKKWVFTGTNKEGLFMYTDYSGYDIELHFYFSCIK